LSSPSGGGSRPTDALRSPVPPRTPGPYALRSPGLPGRTSSDRDAPGVLVELLSGTHPLGRTTTKRRTTAPFWDETFSYPFFSIAPASVDSAMYGEEALGLVVWREKSGERLVVLGRVEIPLGESHSEDAWWPVLSETGRRMGDLRVCQPSASRISLYDGDPENPLLHL
jgi:hypothetical protein